MTCNSLSVEKSYYRIWTSRFSLHLVDISDIYAIIANFHLSYSRMKEKKKKNSRFTTLASFYSIILELDYVFRSHILFPPLRFPEMRIIVRYHIRIISPANIDSGDNKNSPLLSLSLDMSGEYFLRKRKKFLRRFLLLVPRALIVSPPFGFQYRGECEWIFTVKYTVYTYLYLYIRAPLEFDFSDIL